MKSFEDFMESKRSLVKRQKEIQLWQKAVLELLAEKPVESKVVGNEIHVTLDGHFLILYYDRNPFLDGKQLSNADVKSGLDSLFREAGRRELQYPAIAIPNNLNPSYTTAQDVFGPNHFMKYRSE